jgi:hypothetical protein
LVYCQAPKNVGGSVHSELLEELFGYQRMARAVKSLYGCSDAGHNLHVHIQNVMRRLHYVESKAHPCVFIRYVVGEDGKLVRQANGNYVIDCVIYCFVDDVMAFSGATKAVKLLDELQKEGGLKFKSEPAMPSRFTGVAINVSDDGVTWDQRLLAESLDVKDKNVQYDYPLPITKGTDRVSSDAYYELIKGGAPCGPKTAAHFRKILGSLMYLQVTRADLLYSLSFIARFMHEPTKPAYDMLLRVARYAKATADTRLRFPVVTPDGTQAKRRATDTCAWRLDVYTDSTYAKKPTSAYLIVLNDVIVAARSYAQGRVSRSSLASELHAFYDGVDLAKLLRTFMIEMCMGDVYVNVFTDSDDLLCHMCKLNPKPLELNLRPSLICLQDMVSGCPVQTTHPRNIDEDPEHATAEEMRMTADGPAFGRWQAQPVNFSRNEHIELAAAQGIIDAGHIDVHHISGLVNPANDLSKSTDNALIKRVMAGDFLPTTVPRKPRGMLGLGGRFDAPGGLRYALFTCGGIHCGGEGTLHTHSPTLTSSCSGTDIVVNDQPAITSVLRPRASFSVPCHPPHERHTQVPELPPLHAFFKRCFNLSTSDVSFTSPLLFS